MLAWTRVWRTFAPGVQPVLIEGEADGADKLSRGICEPLGWHVEPFPARWEVDEDTPPQRIRRRRDGTLYDVAAGPIRNQRMLDEGKPNFVNAFHHDLRVSRGTLDMVEKVEAAGLPLAIYPWDTRAGAAQTRLM